MILAPKFYFFDVGIANFLLKRKNIEWGSESIGHAFEHFIYMELYTYFSYSGKHIPIRYWRTTSQLEVDFILGDAEVAIEVKSTDNVQSKHTKGLVALSEEYTIGKNIIVSNDPLPKRLGDIDVMPWRVFLDKLWGGVIL